MSDDHRKEPVEEDASRGQPWVVDEETASRLTLLASYVEDDGRLSVPGLVKTMSYSNLAEVRDRLQVMSQRLS